MVFEISGESLPMYFWVVYYLVLIVTFITGFFYLIKNRNIKGIREFTLINLAFTFIFPFVSFHYAIMRTEGNELDYWLQGLSHINLKAYFILISMIVILSWWFIFIKSLNSKKSTSINNQF
ncbi:hypothetical protein [Metabacillus fastidiosus]|uniref:hypothetical protein n=2 Tax=Metabacillus fastidiosus TaxID=1458 RepID=UPI0008265E08|nr:hypothetical protein [Metabacillus fastidiosus]